MIRKIFNKILKNKKTLGSVLSICLVSLFFIKINGANAATIGEDLIAAFLGSMGVLAQGLVGFFALIFGSVIAKLATVAADVLVTVASYSNIIDVTTVKEGWKIVRDLCNMFFIIALLVIAFATILRQENYSAKRLLPKLLIMAVLINFSRMIFGIIIDFGQVVMMTFVATFTQAGIFVDAFKIDKLFTFSKPQTVNMQNAATGWAVALSAVAALFAATASLVILCVLIGILVIRIVMLWIYTILSPFVFLGIAFPPIRGYTNRIWEDFIKQVIIGPVLAFFVWLALSTGPSSVTELSTDASGFIMTAQAAETGASDSFNAFLNEVWEKAQLQGYVIQIGFLLAGSVMAGQLASGAASGIVNMGNRALRSAGTLQPLRRRYSDHRDRVKQERAQGLRGPGLIRAGLTSADRYLGSKVGMTGGIMATSTQKLKNFKDGTWIKNNWRQRRVAKDGLSDFHSKEAIEDKNINKEKEKLSDIKRKREEALDNHNIALAARYDHDADKQQKAIEEAEKKKANLKFSYDDKKYKKYEDGRFYRVNEEGQAINKEGQVIEDESKIGKEGVFAERKGFFGQSKQMKAMSADQAELYRGWREARSGVVAAADAAEDEAIEDEVKQINRENISATEAARSLREDKHLSDHRKKALAMFLSKSGPYGIQGMDYDEVNKARGYLAGNRSMEKKFNENVVESGFGHKLADLDSDTGREKLSKLWSEGKISKFHSSALEDHRFMETFSDKMNAKQFDTFIDRQTAGSIKHREAAEKGLSKLAEGRGVTDADGNIDPIRKQIAKLTGDVTKAFKGIKVDNKDLQEGLDKMFQGLGAKDLAGFDVNTFKRSRLEEVFGNQKDADMFLGKMMNAAANNISPTTVAGARRNGMSEGLAKDFEEVLGQGAMLDEGELSAAVKERYEEGQMIDEDLMSSGRAAAMHESEEKVKDGTLKERLIKRGETARQDAIRDAEKEGEMVDEDLASVAAGKAQAQTIDRMKEVASAARKVREEISDTMKELDSDIENVDAPRRRSSTGQRIERNTRKVRDLKNSVEKRVKDAKANVDKEYRERAKEDDKRVDKMMDDKIEEAISTRDEDRRKG